MIHEEELQLVDGNADMTARNEFWRKWSLSLSMFSLVVLITFLVGVFVAARYSKLNMLRTRGGGAKKSNFGFCTRTYDQVVPDHI